MPQSPSPPVSHDPPRGMEPLLRVAARFGLAGIANTAIGLSVIAGLEFGLGLTPAAANLGGYLVGWGLSYVLNRKLVFRSVAGHSTTAWRYVAAVLVAFAANQAVVALAHRVLALDWVAALPLPTALGALGAQLSGMVCYTGLVFVFCRWWVFADRSAAYGQNELR
ncbi:MAG: GtrA family protein [Phenylobacterium sp.]|uniref:GtrA family protein n=1 Tax=Phenylobacterium sp. TaxID=1871053 RepID=UPI0027362D12|nr:GtrA family protein [Phenylobacterium sp.]MDP3174186.1 GtrA family protein [Phenylobacterium sp.]